MRHIINRYITLTPELCLQSSRSISAARISARTLFNREQVSTTLDFVISTEIFDNRRALNLERCLPSIVVRVLAGAGCCNGCFNFWKYARAFSPVVACKKKGKKWRRPIELDRYRLLNSLLNSPTKHICTKTLRQGEGERRETRGTKCVTGRRRWNSLHHLQILIFLLFLNILVRRTRSVRAEILYPSQRWGM